MRSTANLARNLLANFRGFSQKILPQQAFGISAGFTADESNGFWIGINQGSVK
jgi:hypothetical protein